MALRQSVVVFGLKREDSLGFHGALTHRAILGALERELKHVRMSPVQYLALGQIIDGQGISVSDLSEMLSITGATAVRLIDRMVRDGIVTRETDARDGRIKIIVPTAKAHKLWKQVAEVGPKNLEKGYRGIAPSDIEKAKQVLAQVRANLLD